MGNIIQKFLEELSDALSTERKLTSCDREMQIYTFDVLLGFSSINLNSVTSF